MRRRCCFCRALQTVRRVGTAVSNGKLSLAYRTIKLEGFTLPEQTAQALSDAFAAQWNTRMEQRDFTPQTIQWQDGEAVLLG